MAKVQNGEKYCRKIQPLEYGARTLQTTDRRICGSKDLNVT